MDDFFRTQQLPRGEPQVGAAFVSPPRTGVVLPRRFTTDSGRVPTLSAIPPIPRASEPQDFAATTVRLLEPERKTGQSLSLPPGCFFAFCAEKKA